LSYRGIALGPRDVHADRALTLAHGLRKSDIGQVSGG